MKETITLILLGLLTWSYFQYRREKGLMFYQKESDVSDGCMGKMIAAGVVLFLIISLIYQRELLEAVGKKFIE
jgi:hypothetical protein